MVLAVSTLMRQTAMFRTITSKNGAPPIMDLGVLEPFLPTFTQPQNAFAQRLTEYDSHGIRVKSTINFVHSTKS